MKKLISFICLVAIIFSSCTQTQEEKNLNTQTSKDVSEFEYNGHKYIKFTWGKGYFATSGVVHNPNCPCFSNDSIK